MLKKNSNSQTPTGPGQYSVNCRTPGLYRAALSNRQAVAAEAAILHFSPEWSAAVREDQPQHARDTLRLGFAHSRAPTECRPINQVVRNAG